MTRAVVQCLPSAAKDAARLAARLGTPMHEIDLHRFPDGEIRVTVGPAAPTTIIYVSLDRPNDKLLTILFAAEALRRSGAERLVLVAPYFCYMRQDAAFHNGEAIGQKVIGKLIAQTVDRVVTVDAHLHRTKDIEDVFPRIEADNLSAMPAIADFLQAKGFDKTTIIVGPDAESKPWVSDLAGRLSADYVVGQKTRRGDRSVDIAFVDRARFAGRPALLVDDIASSGGTLLVCTKALAAAGASTIDAIVTHALFPAEMTDAFLNAGLRSIRSSYSVPHPTNAIVLDDILAKALREEIASADEREQAV